MKRKGDVKKRRKMRTINALILRAAALAGIVWLAAMACATVGLAQRNYDIFYPEMVQFSRNTVQDSGLAMALDDDIEPGSVEYYLWDTLKAANESNSSMGFSTYAQGPKVLRETGYRYDAAVVILGPDGEPLLWSGDFIYFRYLTEEEWLAGVGTSRKAARAEINWENISEGSRVELRELFHGMNPWALKITGDMEEQEITPWRVEYIDYDIFSEALDNIRSGGEASYELTISQIIEQSNIPWITAIQMDGAEPENSVTLYSTYCNLSLYDPQGKVTAGGKEYENLLEYAKQVSTSVEPVHYGGPYTDLYEYQKDSIWEIIRPEARHLYDLSALGEEGAGSPPLLFSVVTVVRAKPITSAVQSLVWVYLFTAVIGALCVFTYRKILQRNLIDVMNLIAVKMGENMGRIYTSEYRHPRWREPEQLVESYRRAVSERERDKDEMKRLTTALDYSQRAEQERRALVANMAHELKTPLAVVKSHAEGLREHIAEDRREEYLDTIMSETERMDGIILQMLELSRIEAGRVKLRRQEFDLGELVRETLSRLAPEIGRRGLEVEEHIESSPVSADRDRTGEAVENILANAVKYALQNGNIKVYCSSATGGGAQFTAYNDAAPLDEEALVRVWEPFYRVSASRTDRGTGLGLSIVKGIVELHGGTVFSRNVPGGVEFGFRI